MTKSTPKNRIDERVSSKSAPFLKAFVTAMRGNIILRWLFLIIGFFTVRLFFPVQYLIIRELLDCKSILDLGCGPHSMIPILPSDIHTVGVEVFDSYYKEASEKGRHKQLIQSDITTIDFPENSFEAVAMMDVIEHLDKQAGLDLLKKMEKWASKKVVVFTPSGFMHQDEYDENPYLQHKSGWSVEEFKNHGFKVYGVRGFKGLAEKTFEHEDKNQGFLDKLTDLTQVITYHFPKQAFQLFCVKTHKQDA